RPARPWRADPRYPCSSWTARRSGGRCRPSHRRRRRSRCGVAGRALPPPALLPPPAAPAAHSVRCSWLRSAQLLVDRRKRGGACAGADHLVDRACNVALLHVDPAYRVEQQDRVEALPERVEHARAHAVLRGEAADVEGADTAVAEPVADRPALLVRRLEGRVPVVGGAGPLRDDGCTRGQREVRGERGAGRIPDAVGWPGATAGLEMTGLGRVPVAGCQDGQTPAREAGDVVVQYGYDGVAVRYGERAARTEVVLHVDHEECALCHGSISGSWKPSPRGVASGGAGRKLAPGTSCSQRWRSRLSGLRFRSPARAVFRAVSQKGHAEEAHNCR